MNRWNVAGKLHRPKYMTIGSNNPLGVLNAAFYWSPSLIRILLYPARRSSFVKYFISDNLSNKTVIMGSGPLSGIVPAFKAL